MKVRMDKISAATKQSRLIPFFLSDLGLQELGIPKPIGELPDLNILGMLILSGIYSCNEESGEPSDKDLVRFTWTRLWQLVRVIAKRPPVSC